MGLLALSFSVLTTALFGVEVLEVYGVEEVVVFEPLHFKEVSELVNSHLLRAETYVLTSDFELSLNRVR